MKVEFTALYGGERLDAYLAKVSEFSRSHVKKLTDEGAVLVNKLPQKGKYILKEGDVIELEAKQPEPLEIKPVSIPLDIVYQDAHLAVINKQQGLTVHAGNGTDDNTLVNALLYSLDSLSGINGVIRPGIVHRIDKDTSGLLVVAKNDKAHVSLASQIEKKTCQRKYLALLHGRMAQDEGRIQTYIDRSKRDRTSYCVSAEGCGKEAITDFKVIARYKDYTLCEFSLKTGRTHQIRVHSKHKGHPVVGDKTYGPKRCPFDLEGQLLHAYSLTFTHPESGEVVSFTAPLPDYFENVLKKIENTKM